MTSSRFSEKGFCCLSLKSGTLVLLFLELLFLIITTPLLFFTIRSNSSDVLDVLHISKLFKVLPSLNSQDFARLENIANTVRSNLPNIKVPKIPNPNEIIYIPNTLPTTNLSKLPGLKEVINIPNTISAINLPKIPDPKEVLHIPKNLPVLNQLNFPNPKDILVIPNNLFGSQLPKIPDPKEVLTIPKTLPSINLPKIPDPKEVLTIPKTLPSINLPKIPDPKEVLTIPKTLPSINLPKIPNPKEVLTIPKTLPSINLPKIPNPKEVLTIPNTLPSINLPKNLEEVLAVAKLSKVPDFLHNSHRLLKHEIDVLKKIGISECSTYIPNLKIITFFWNISTRAVASILLFVNALIFATVTAGLFGIAKGKPTLLIPYLLLRIIYAVVAIVLLLALIFARTAGQGCIVTSFIIQFFASEYLLNICIIVDVLILILEIYFVIVVCSYYKELDDNGSMRNNENCINHQQPNILLATSNQIFRMVPLQQSGLKENSPVAQFQTS